MSDPEIRLERFPRRYLDDQDFVLMKNLLVEGRQAGSDSYYIHVGDLSWWLFYTTPEDDLRKYIYLWENASGLLGWCLLSPRWRTFDAFVRPELRASSLMRDTVIWSIERINEIVKICGGKDIRTIWILWTDQTFIALLESLGFRPTDSCMYYLEFNLENALIEIPIPTGYEVRNVAGFSEIRQRSMASYQSFGSTMTFDDYCTRYERFMRSPVYDPMLDLVVVTPDGDFASFCLIWLDLTNRVGLFEPVGTHPEYQHKGFGKVVLCEGLRRMKALGMHNAIVYVENDNPDALNLYESVGFRQVNRLVTYTRLPVT